MNTTPLLQVTSVAKRFGGVQALKGVDFDLHKGEVHALLGENGAGKSTLMNILSGVHQPDTGELLLEGTAVVLSNPAEAQAAGIATIFQELDLVPSLSVTDNLFLGREIMRFGTIHSAAMEARARELCQEFGIRLDVTQAVQNLSIGQRQLAAILKALSFASKVLIMDEPTAALTALETERLFDVVRQLKARGLGIIYISHRLEEVPVIADRVTVMRDGRVVGEEEPSAPQSRLVSLLVGRPLDELYPRRTGDIGERVLTMEAAHIDGARSAPGWTAPKQVDLTLHAGEIVGLAGIMGAGRTELLYSLYGLSPSGKWAGRIEICGKPARLRNVAAARGAGIAFVTDDRRGSGLMIRVSVAANLVLSVLRRVSPSGVISPKREKSLVEKNIKLFDIRPPRGDLIVGNLSGGNQQKVVLAKEISTEPRVLLLDEPTRGVDVGAKGEIYHRLRELAQTGLAVLVASSEMPELMGLCDRIIVLREGRSVAEFTGTFDEHSIMAAAGGAA